MLPSRPRLAEHVAARRHIVDGLEIVVLNDTRSGAAIQIGPREWRLLSCADGTRDLVGILAAAERIGGHAREPALREFLDQLNDAGLLCDANEELSEVGSISPLIIDDHRPVEVLPDFSLTCDGRGSCCRIYGSVLFSPAEAARARSLLPLVFDGGYSHDRAFTPERGIWIEGRASIGTMTDGRCGYLADDGGCRVHRAGGSVAKPRGCQLYPLTLVDDGETIRASVAVECACVLASVGKSGGNEIISNSIQFAKDIDEHVHVTRLSHSIAVTKSRSIPLGEWIKWSRKASSDDSVSDPIAWLLRTADQFESDADIADFQPNFRDISDRINVLHRASSRRLRQYETWRSPLDLALHGVRDLVDATNRLRASEELDRALSKPPRDLQSEQFYLRAGLHGHQFVGEHAVVDMLRNAAVRLLVARVFRASDDTMASDPAYAHPLALVEALCRGHDLAAIDDAIHRT